MYKKKKVIFSKINVITNDKRLIIQESSWTMLGLEWPNRDTDKNLEIGVG